MKTNLKFLTLAILFSFATLISCDEKKEKKETVSEEKTEVKEEAPKTTAKGPMKAKMIEHFKSIDSNNDGKVVQEEFDAHLKAEFVSKDANKDGKIQKDECGKFDDLNTDGNDFVSEEEFTNGHADMMKKVDADGNGSFTQEEFLSYKKEMMKKMKGMMKCGGEMKEAAEEKIDDAKKTMKCAPGKCGGN